MIPRVTAAGRVRAYLADHPHATIPEIAAALGMTYAQAKEGKRLVLAPRSDGPRPPRETLMLRGAGERRHDCAGYEACLAGAADRYPGAGNPCTLPVGHAGGHEARSADGRLLAISLPPALGDIPADVRAAETGTTGPTPDEEEPYNYDERDTSPLPRTIGEAVFGGPAPKPPVRTKGDRPAWLEGAETAWVEDIGTPDRERIADAWRRIFRVPLPDGVPHAIHDAGDTTYTLWTYGRVAVSAPDGHSILKLTPRAWATFIGYKGRKGGAS